MEQTHHLPDGVVLDDVVVVEVVRNCLPNVVASFGTSPARRDGFDATVKTRRVSCVFSLYLLMNAYNISEISPQLIQLLHRSTRRDGPRLTPHPLRWSEHESSDAVSHIKSEDSVQSVREREAQRPRTMQNACK